MRFSLGSMFLATAFVAISCACLIFATVQVTSWLGIALQAFLMVCVLGSFYAPRNHRAFWGGCAIVGWACFWNDHTERRNDDVRRLEDTVLFACHPLVVREVQADDGAIIKTPDLVDFWCTGKQVANFIAAFVGGGVALWFDRCALRKTT